MKTQKWYPLKHRVTHAFAIACLAASATSCADRGDAEPEDTTSTESALFSLPTTQLWNGATAANRSPLGTAVFIPVCFAVRPRLQADGTTACPAETSSTVDCSGRTTERDTGLPLDVAFVRQRIRTAIERTWVRYANIAFTGWNDCPVNTAGLHQDTQLTQTIVIQLQQLFTPPPNQNCSSDAACQQTTPNAVCVNNICQQGGVGDFTWTLGKSSTVPTVVQYNWPAMVHYSTRDVVHEMGHALGFPHEWTRSDFSPPPGCNATDYPDLRSVSGGILLTDFPDPGSIMNYCGGWEVPDDGTISAGDIVGVQRAYGRKSKGALVGFGGMCANINGGVTTVGASIIAYPCLNQINDLWFRDTTVQRFRADMGSGVQRCLNVSGGVVNPNAPTSVISWTCDSNSNEAFPLSNVEWHGMGSLCATASGGSIIMNTCDGTSAQKWTFLNGSTAGGALRFDQILSTSTGKCVTATTTTGGVGEQLSLVTCSNTNTKQRFAYPGQGVIGYGNFCMNVSGGVTDPGHPVVLWNGCTSTPRAYNEQFTLVGNMKSLGQCLDATNHSQVSVAPCSSTNVDQIWEYYL